MIVTSIFAFSYNFLSLFIRTNETKETNEQMHVRNIILWSWRDTNLGLLDAKTIPKPLGQKEFFLTHVVRYLNWNAAMHEGVVSLARLNTFPTTNFRLF